MQFSFQIKGNGFWCKTYQIEVFFNPVYLSAIHFKKLTFLNDSIDIGTFLKGKQGYLVITSHYVRLIKSNEV